MEEFKRERPVVVLPSVNNRTTTQRRILHPLPLLSSSSSSPSSSTRCSATPSKKQNVFAEFGSPTTMESSHNEPQATSQNQTTLTKTTTAVRKPTNHMTKHRLRTRGRPAPPSLLRQLNREQQRQHQDKLASLTFCGQMLHLGGKNHRRLLQIASPSPPSSKHGTMGDTGTSTGKVHGRGAVHDIDLGEDI